MFRDQILDVPGSDSREGGIYPLFSLYRQVVQPRPTFEQLLGKENLEAAYSRFEQDDDDHFLCENILEMNVTFNIRYVEGEADAEKGEVAYKMVSIPVIASNRRTNRVELYGDRIVAGGTTYQNARIDSAMISITVLTEEGVAMVEQIRQGRRKAPKKMADFFAKYTRSYARLVSLPQPL